MSDLIDRKEAIQAITKDMEELAVTSLPQRDAGIRMGMDISRQIIGEVPSARPTKGLVYCRECKNWHEWEHGTGSCHRSENGYNWFGVDSDDYCSFGERKDE